MASDSKNVCRTASQCCDGWLDERIVGAVLEGGSQKSFLLCLSIYKVIVQRGSVNQRKEGKVKLLDNHTYSISSIFPDSQILILIYPRLQPGKMRIPQAEMRIFERESIQLFQSQCTHFYIII